jgi:hypothetical protein
MCLLVCTHCYPQVDQGDVILTFSYSHIVATVLCTAAREGKRFRVAVVDSRPESEGRLMLKVGLIMDVRVHTSVRPLHGAATLTQFGQKSLLPYRWGQLGGNCTRGTWVAELPFLTV